MRISVWSSDVCSTRTHKTAIAFQISRQHWGDQIRHRLLLPVCLGICDCIILKPSMTVGWNDNRQLDEGSVWNLAELDRRHCCAAMCQGRSGIARKGGVSGTSVYVRVDYG